MYDDGKNIFMVMELMRGGELLDRILKHKSLSEREAALIMYTLASTFTFLHEEGVRLILCCLVLIFIYPACITVDCRKIDSPDGDSPA